MVRQLLPIGALLLGSALLLFAGGIHALVLPVRGTAEGFSSAALGLLGTGWAIGYVVGCIVAPRFVAAVGHVRTFGVMCALAAVSILLQALVVTPWAWIPVRAVSGFCFAGAAMIVESWLNDRAQPSTRGRIFGIYTMVNLFAVTAGQMSVSLGDTTTFTFFAIGAMVYCAALVPTALSTSASPAPLTSVRLEPRALWRNSPVAVVAVFLVGVSNGAFGALSAVYADRVGLALTSVALFASVPLLAGAVAQAPIGWASDRMDRRKVLVATAVVALCVDVAFIALAPEGRLANLVLAGLFGAAIFGMYPIIVAHANDHAPPGTSIQVSGGLLMIFGLGSIVGPTAAGAVMSGLGVGPRGLFVTTIAAHLLLVIYAGWRITRREAVAVDDKTAFQVSMPARVSTPETVALSAGEAEALPLPLVPDAAEPAAEEAVRAAGPDDGPDDGQGGGQGGGQDGGQGGGRNGGDAEPPEDPPPDPPEDPTAGPPDRAR